MKQLTTLAWVTVVATLANLAILIAVGAKLQVAKEDFTRLAAGAAANPVDFIMGIFKQKGATP